MTIQLPELPYAQDALSPHISAETLEFHYGKHHATYVTKLNAAIEGTDLEGKDLVEIVRASSGGTFNNAAQVWNHTFYWHSLSPTGCREPTGAIKDAIAAKFSRFDQLKEDFPAAAVGNLGSGWTGLVQHRSTKLDMGNTRAEREQRT